MLAFVAACATEVQEPPSSQPLDIDNGGSGGGEPMGTAGTAKGGTGAATGGVAGTHSSGSGGGATGGAPGTGGATGGNATTGGNSTTGGGGASGGSKASGGSGGASTGGKGGAGGSGGKASGGSGGSGGGGGKTCGTGKLAITGATASGVERGGLEAPNAVDGDGGTRWSSAVQATGWLTVDLGQPAHVSRVVIDWETAYGIDYEIQIGAAAAGPWTTLLHVTNGNGDTDNLTNLTPGNGRYVRMNGIMHAGMYGFSIFELEVYGDLDETCK